MSTTKTRIKNPYGIRFDLSCGRDGIIDGSIFIDGVKYYLNAVSKDIIDLLGKLTDNYMLMGSLLPYNGIVFLSVNDLPENARVRATEVKLRLMACNTFQEMSDTNKKKLEAIKRYYKMIEDEARHHRNKIEDIEMWLRHELE